MCSLTKIIYIFLCLLYLFSCSDERTYTKFVFENPKKGISPYDVVTDVDIWFSRLKYRGLVKLDSRGLFEVDLAKSITHSKFQRFNIKIKKDVFFKNKHTIDSKVIRQNLLNLKEKGVYSNFKSIKEISDYELEIELLKLDKDFIKNLGSHDFLIFDLNDISNVSGAYFYNKKLNLYERIKKSNYPKYVNAVKFKNEKLDIANTKYFDTSLSPEAKIDGEDLMLEYKLFETWGLVLNLKDRFNALEERKSLHSSIDRNKLIEIALKGHEPVSSFNGAHKLSHIKGKNKEFSYKLDIPIEIGEKGTKICDFLSKKSKVICNFVSFDKLLENIKTGRFEASLLSVTIEKPYLSSLTSVLLRDSLFSIINISINIPEKLRRAKGEAFVNLFSSFIEQNKYFIPISQPKRRIYGHKIKTYKPSLFTSGYDSIENLIR